MSDDIPPAKRGRRPARTAAATVSVAIRFEPTDYDQLYRIMRQKRHEYLRTMIREWVLDRLGIEIARSKQFGTPKIGEPNRLM